MTVAKKIYISLVVVSAHGAAWLEYIPAEFAWCRFVSSTIISIRIELKSSSKKPSGVSRVRFLTFEDNPQPLELKLNRRR